MARLIFASALLLFGAAQSLRGPFYALLLYLGIAYFRPELWIWTGELRAISFSFWVGLYAVGSLLVFRESFKMNFASWLVVAFCLHGLVSTLLSAYSGWCLPWWEGFAKVTVIAVLIIGLVNTEERLRLTLLVIAFALGFEGVKQGWVHLLTAPDAQNINGVEILGDNNGVAVGMLMLGAIILALFQTTKRFSFKALYAFMAVGVFFRSLTSYSRGGFLAFGAMIAVYLVRSKRLFRTVFVLGGVVMLLAVLPQSYWDRMNTIDDTSDQRDASIAGRLYFWGIAREMANDHPFLGVGTSGFQAAYNNYDQVRPFGGSRAVHSMWFGVLAEQGYVGFLMFCAILLLALRACSRARSLTKRDPDREQLFAIASALQAALVAVMVGGTFLSYHYVEIVWHFVALSFATERVAMGQATVTAAVRAPVMLGQQAIRRMG